MTSATDSSAEFKQCPDCAEQVRAAAAKCRYCGFRFGPPLNAPVPTAPPEASASTSTAEPAVAKAQVLDAGEDNPKTWEIASTFLLFFIVPQVIQPQPFQGFLAVVIVCNFVMWAVLGAILTFSPRSWGFTGFQRCVFAAGSLAMTGAFIGHLAIWGT